MDRAGRVPAGAGGGRRWRPVAAALLVALAAAACGSPSAPAASGRRSRAATDHPAPSPGTGAPAGRDPEAVTALLRIAQRFNDAYERGDYGPVYDRWDARSRAVISRGEYLRRHIECPAAPGAPARVEGAAPGPNGGWLVRYEIGGIQFVDHWFYVDGRWVFDLVLSNPDAARLYRLPFRRYAAAIGCAG